MSLIGFFVRYVFTLIFIPVFVMFLVGKPVLLIKLLNKILHFKVQGNQQLIHILLLSFTLFDAYYIYAKSNAEKKIKRLIKNEIINPEEYSINLSHAHSYERNIYIFLTCIVMFLTMHKFGERHLRITELKEEYLNKKKLLDGLNPQKNADKKKRD